MKQISKEILSGFWAGGSSRYIAALDQEEKTKLKDLEKALRSAASNAQREELIVRIKQTKSDYRQKRRDAEHMLFSQSSD